MLVTARNLSGLKLRNGALQAHIFDKSSNLATALRNANKDKLSPVHVIHVPPDFRDTAMSTVLGQSELAHEHLEHVYVGRVKDKFLNCLFDSGATSSFMSQSMAQKLGLVPQHSSFKSVSVANGKSVPILGTVNLAVQLGPTVLNITAQVLSSFLPHIELIVGQSAMKQYSVELKHNPVQCVIQNTTAGGGAVILDNATGEYKSTYSPDQPNLCLAVEDHSGLPNQISCNAALKLMRQKGSRCFVAFIKPTEIRCPTDPAVCSALNIEEVDNVPEEYKTRLKQLVDSFPDIFSETPQGGGALIDDLDMTIKLMPGVKPPFRRNFRLSPLELTELKKQVLEFLEKGILSPSNSPYGAPVLFVQKPNGGLRFCLDYRALNERTVKTRYALPRIDDLLDAAVGCSHFSTLDLAGGYYQLKITPADREKTAFTTPFGQFEWNVLPMGLTNAPAAFMHTMQKVFEQYIGDFVLVYLDDILVMSKTPEDHLRHLQAVFETLRKHRLTAKLSKCKFLQKEVKYLGHLLSAEGVKPDPGKIKTLLDWEFPSNATGMMQFLGLANYFRRFIPNLSRLAAPLYHLTKKGTVFQKGEEALLAFNAIKQLLVSPPILAYPNPELPYELISDASLTGCGAVLTQENKPIAYFSSKFSSAERNYTTGEQEMLGIIKALKEWRCYLEGTENLTLVTDHNPLTFFSVQPTLSRRQARWSEFLSRFHFTVKYRPGASNPADPLSRLYGTLDSASLAIAVSEFDSDLLARIKSATLLDPHFHDEKSIRKYDKEVGYFTYQGRIVVPSAMQTDIISEHHANVVSGHFSWSRTYDLVSRHFWWPGMRESIQDFVTSCTSCQRNKSSTQRPFGLLSPLSVPDSRWHTVTMDFIMDLPRSASGYDAIMVLVDKLTKYVHLIPVVKTCSAEDVARYFIQHVYQYHGLPKVLISDRDPRFTSNFWKAFCKRLGMDPRYSTAFHPQTDGQTERTNRVLEEVLRHFIDGDHKNWEDLLPLAAFAMNNAKSSTTGETPFYLNHGSHPHTPLTLGLPEGTLPTLEVVFKDMESTLTTRIKELITAAQDRQKTYADNRFRRPHTFQVGDKVMLSTKNLKFRVGVKKLHPKYLGPFEITEMVGSSNNAVRLRLPSSYHRIHPVFHVSLLKPFHEGSSFKPLPPEPEVEDGMPYYKVERILGTRVRKVGRRKVQEFLIQWVGYDHSHNSWEPRKNLTDDLLKDYPL